MKRRRPLWLILLWLLVALVLAFYLREAVTDLIVLPLAYVLWLLNMLYRAIPQPIVWLVLVAIMLYVISSILLKNVSLRGLRSQKTELTNGPVKELAGILTRESRGVYFKWQVARTLSELALDLQQLRTHDPARQLDIHNETIPPDVHRYLDAGLNTSFSDYPVAGPFQSVQKTPFDADLEPVLAYLESQMEMEDDRRRS